jgi:methionine-rich copper-binding protein CopC
MLKRIITLLATAAALALFAPAPFASGHAEYDHSVPNDGEVVTSPPGHVDVYFDEHLAPEGPNNLNVIGPNGQDVDNEDVTLDPNDETHLRITLIGALPQGLYTVEWQSTSEHDGDTEEGSFTFTIDYPPPLGGFVNSPLGGDDGSPWQAWAVAGLAAGALAVIAGGLAYGRRRA